VAATLLLTAPWVLLWSADRNARPWRLAASTLFSVVPPVGSIGWASPLLAAGALFPGLGWAGLALTMLVPVSVTIRSFPLRAVSTLMAIASIANWIAVPAPAVPGWEARDLSLAKPMERSGGLDALAIQQKVKSLIESSNADVLILPESAIPRWNDATALIWEPVADRLAATNRLVLAGTTFPEPGSRKQRNGAVVLGLANSIPRISQRLPVPIAMWNPFHDDGFVACPSCPDTFEIAGQRVALLICYEQLLVLPVLLSLAESPSVLVGISSTAWTQQTSIPRSQELCLWAWGRLFCLPVLNATSRLER
jgi:apolipoprotein N-acyltransferase